MIFLLLAFMLATFAIGTEKFIVVGLLPNIAEYFHVPLGQASQLVTYYVFGITISGPIFAFLLRKVDKKLSLMLLMIIFIVGNIMAFMAPTYEIILLGRVVASFTHAPFIGIANMLITELSSEKEKSSRVGLVFVGMTIANIIGVPLGTIIGHKYGWQATFQLITVIGGLTMLMLFFTLRKIKIQRVEKVIREDQPNFIEEFKLILQRPQIIFTFLITVTNFISLYFCLTYLTVTLTEVTGFSKQTAGYILSLFGIGSTLGTIIGGRMYNRKLSFNSSMPSNLYWAIFIISGMIASSLLFGFGAHDRIIASSCVFLFGFCTFFMVPFMQSRTIEKSIGLSSFASVLHVASFNLGSGIGSMIAGMLITGGAKLTTLPMLVIISGVFGLIFTNYSMKLERRHHREQLG